MTGRTIEAACGVSILRRPVVGLGLLRIEEGCGVGEALPILYFDTPNMSCMHGDGGLGIDLVAS
jgi:hypothetical protein